jgi:hypothetical protein
MGLTGILLQGTIFFPVSQFEDVSHISRGYNEHMVLLPRGTKPYEGEHFLSS